MGVNIVTIGAVVVPFAILGALVDTDGNAATNQTLLGDIDMGVSTLGDLKMNISTGAVAEANAFTRENAVLWYDTSASNIVVGGSPLRLGAASVSFSNADRNMVIGNCSSAWGDNNWIGDFSSAWGTNNAIGSFSSAWGLDNYINNYSLVFGHDNSIGDFSSAFGHDNSIGDFSSAWGNDNDAGDSAFVFGSANRAWNDAFVMGVGNLTEEETSGFSFVFGTAAASTNSMSYVWNAYPGFNPSDDIDAILAYPKYYSHGLGSYSINPVGGLHGFWIGETNMHDHIVSTVRPLAIEWGAAKQDILPYPTNEIPYAAISGAPIGMTTNVVKDIVTNVVVVGYTEWTYTGDTSSSQAYSITQAQSGSSYVFTLWDTKTSSSLGTSTTSELNPLSLSFTVSGGTIVAMRSPKIRNSLGLARYADVQELDEKIDTMDTSYYRVAGITNKNQSVQYVATPAGTTTLQIQLPESGMTKDWLVYVLATDDLTLVLPPANYWVVSETVTNAIPASTPTALYFSQITDDTYSIGRQELIPITVDTRGAILSRQIREKMKLRGTRARILKSARPAESK